MHNTIFDQMTFLMTEKQQIKAELDRRKAERLNPPVVNPYSLPPRKPSRTLAELGYACPIPEIPKDFYETEEEAKRTNRHDSVIKRAKGVSINDLEVSA